MRFLYFCKKIGDNSMTPSDSYPHEQFLYINPLTDYGFKKVFGD